MRTALGARAVQIVWSSRRGSRDIEHIGSAHDGAGLELLRAAARHRMVPGRVSWAWAWSPPGRPGEAPGGGPLPVTASRMGCLLGVLEHAHRILRLEDAADGDQVFRLLVLARVIEPASKLGSLRVLEEAGISPPSYATLKRRLPDCAKDSWRQEISAACAAHAGLGPASLVLYDVSTLYVGADCRYRTIEIQAGPQVITAADPLPDDLRGILDRIHGRASVH